MKGSPTEAQLVLARNFRCVRKELGLSQAILSRQSGLPQQMLSHIEGASVNVTLKTLDKLAKSVGLPVRKLLTPRVPPK